MSARDVREQAAVLVRAWEGGYFDAFAERWGWRDEQVWDGWPRTPQDKGEGPNARRRDAWDLARELFGESPRKGLTEELRRGHGPTGDEVVRWLGLAPLRHWGRPK